MRVMVMEDEAAIRTILCRTLEEARHEVLEAETEWEALELCLSRRVDLAIVDIALGGQDGICAMAAIRRLRPGVPLIVVSGGDREAILDRIQAKGLGSGVWWLGKPFLQGELLRLIGRALGN